MTRHRVPVWTALALTAGTLLWALLGLPGAPAACLPADCDCEAAGPGPIRQPANAWSSLALSAAGLFLLIVSPGFAGGDAAQGRRGGKPPETRPGEARGPQARTEGASSSPPQGRGRRARAASAEGEVTRGRASPTPFRPPPNPLPASQKRETDPPEGRRDGAVVLTRHLAAGALVAVGLGAFLYHAGLTAWAARLDGITAAALTGALLLHGVARIAHAVRSREKGRGISWLRSAPWLLLALAAACWWLGQSGAPWCRPGSLWQAHAAWHLLAAAAFGLWLAPAGTRPETRAGSTLRAERPTDP